MRVVQPAGRRGSLKWIQRAVGERWSSLEQPIKAAIGPRELDWLSPLQHDDFAEYRDGAFLDRIGHPGLLPALRRFWPARGPQWDALARSGAGDVILVEAKAHVAEMCSPGTSAGPASRARIESSLERVASCLGARAGRAGWADHFYQLANRMAHLHFLRSEGVPAWLALVNFTGDSDMGGPQTAEAWHAAYEVAFHVMGLPHEHALSPYIIHAAVPVQPG